MVRHIGYVADEFLLKHGFTILDPGPDQKRVATRGHISFPLEPRCWCEYCPMHDNPRYVLLKTPTAPTDS